MKSECRTWRPPSLKERALLEEFFRRSREIGQNVVFLKNYERFPEEIGRDVDIYVPRDATKRMKALLFQVASGLGEFRVHESRRSYVHSMFFTFKGDEARSLQVDFIPGSFTWHGLVFIPDDSPILSGCRRSGDFLVLSPGVQAAYLLLQNLLWGKKIPLKYVPLIKAATDSQEGRTTYERTISEALGPGALHELTPEKLDSLASFGQLRSLSLKIKLSLLSRNIATRGFSRTARSWIEYFLTELALYLKPSAPVVAVYGPDGSGKTTLLKVISVELKDLFAGQCLQLHLRPRLLPEIGILLGVREPLAFGTTVTPGKHSHGFWTNLARTLYYLIDVWIGHAVLIRRRLGQFFLVLFDRYSDDILVDPTRYGHEKVGILERCFSAALPRPDLGYVLIGPPELIHARKPELSIEAIKTLLGRYQAFAQERNYRILDITRPPQELVMQVRSDVHAFLYLRAARLKDEARSHQ
jgi:thymidylate kinase